MDDSDIRAAASGDGLPTLPDDEPTRQVVHRLRAFWRGVGTYRKGAFQDFVEQAIACGELTDHLPDDHPVNKAIGAAGRLFINGLYGGQLARELTPDERGHLFALMAASMPPEVMEAPPMRSQEPTGGVFDPELAIDQFKAIVPVLKQLSEFQTQWPEGLPPGDNIVPFAKELLRAVASHPSARLADRDIDAAARAAFGVAAIADDEAGARAAGIAVEVADLNQLIFLLHSTSPESRRRTKDMLAQQRPARGCFVALPVVALSACVALCVLGLAAS